MTRELTELITRIVDNSHTTNLEVRLRFEYNIAREKNIIGVEVIQFKDKIEREVAYLQAQPEGHFTWILSDAMHYEGDVVLINVPDGYSAYSIIMRLIK